MATGSTRFTLWTLTIECVVAIQEQADLLKNVSDTTVIAVGIDSGFSVTELNGIASDPQTDNVILVPDNSSYDQLTERLEHLSCNGRYLSVIEYRNTNIIS